MELDFTGKAAIVTGAASGIGRSIAQQLASSGAAVIVLDVNADGVKGTVAAIGGGAIECVADVTQAEPVASALSEAVTKAGGLDILVNCAGRSETHAFLEGNPDIWRRLIEVNLLGTINVTHAAVPLIIERGSGRVVNIASDAARIGSGGETVYSAAKGGVISFTKSLAREVARNQITVNCVCPGPTETPMLAESGAGDAGIVEKLIRATPLRRIGQPEDIASAVAYLTSDQACHITGQVLSVSGGLTMV